ncbi:MAG: CsbD family protein [Rhodobacteraceae bacterium]|nr:CsbD family protein [Paracoccaceae bacterium]
MNWDQIAGEWKNYLGKAKSEWGQLTDDELRAAEGDRERLEGLIQKKYGDSKEDARRKVDQWLERVA